MNAENINTFKVKLEIRFFWFDLKYISTGMDNKNQIYIADGGYAVMAVKYTKNAEIYINLFAFISELFFLYFLYK